MAISKREQTKQEIFSHAMGLFELYGYDEVTVAAISESVGVSRITFFRNYPTRADVIRTNLNIEPVVEHIAYAPEGLGAFEMTLWAALRHSESLSPVRTQTLDRIFRVIGSSATLSASIFGPRSLFEDQLTTAVMKRGISHSRARSGVGAFLGSSVGMLTAKYETGGFIDLHELHMELRNLVSSTRPGSLLDTVSQ